MIVSGLKLRRNVTSIKSAFTYELEPFEKGDFFLALLDNSSCSFINGLGLGYSFTF